MGFVIEAGGRGSALEILDARNIEAAPVASIRLPHRVPPGIHGAWLQAQAGTAIGSDAGKGT